MAALSSVWFATVVEIHNPSYFNNYIVGALLLVSYLLFVGSFPGYVIFFSLFGRKNAWKGAFLTWLVHFIFWVYLPAINAVR